MTKTNKLKRILIILISFLFVVALINGIIFITSFRTGIFDRWTKEQYAGVITKVNDDSIAIQDGVNKDNNFEKTILLSKDLIVLEGKKNVGIESLQIGNFIVVIGDILEDGRIQAKIIRIFNSNTAYNPRPL